MYGHRRRRFMCPFDLRRCFDFECPRSFRPIRSHRSQQSRSAVACLDPWTWNLVGMGQCVWLDDYISTRRFRRSCSNCPSSGLCISAFHRKANMAILLFHLYRNVYSFPICISTTTYLLCLSVRRMSVRLASCCCCFSLNEIFDLWAAVQWYNFANWRHKWKRDLIRDWKNMEKLRTRLKDLSTGLTRSSNNLQDSQTWMRRFSICLLIHWLNKKMTSWKSPSHFG